MIVVGMGYGYSWHHVRLRDISDMSTGTTNHNMNYSKAVVEQGTIGSIKLKEASIKSLHSFTCDTAGLIRPFLLSTCCVLKVEHAALHLPTQNMRDACKL